MRALLDINLLLALFDPGHAQHERAHGWWRANARFGWASCPLTQNGFVRVISQPRYPSPMSTVEALRLLRRNVENTEHEFWMDELSVLNPDRFVLDRILGPSQLTDVYLLGLAVEKGGRLATFDQAVPLSSVIGATYEHLEVL